MAKAKEKVQFSKTTIALALAADNAVTGQSVASAKLAEHFLGGKTGEEVARSAIKQLGLLIKNVALKNSAIVRRATSEHIAILANGDATVHDRDARLEAAQKARKALGLARKQGKVKNRKNSTETAVATMLSSTKGRATLTKWALKAGFAMTLKVAEKAKTDPRTVSRHIATPMGAPASAAMPS